MDRKSLLSTAKGRIEATIETFIKKNGFVPWLEAFSKTNFDFIENKYGKYQYESYYDNQLYGLGALTRYANNLSELEDIHCVMPHGVLMTEVIWSKEYISGLPIACYSDHAMRIYGNAIAKYKANSKIFSCLHPFKNIMDILDKNKVASDKYNSIYFPSHSTGKELVSWYAKDSGNRLNQLRKLRNKNKTLNLCIYYLDYYLLKKNGLWDEYSSIFDKVFCCGHRLDPAFLINLGIILSQHKKLITDNIGSQVVYGSMAGLEINLTSSNELEDGYVYNDLITNRKDISAREMLGCQTLAIHRVANQYKYSMSSLLARYYYSFLTDREYDIQRQSLSEKVVSSHSALKKEFNLIRYPLVHVT